MVSIADQHGRNKSILLQLLCIYAYQRQDPKENAMSTHLLPLRSGSPPLTSAPQSRATDVLTVWGAALVSFAGRVFRRPVDNHPDRLCEMSPRMLRDIGAPEGCITRATAARVSTRDALIQFHIGRDFY